MTQHHDECPKQIIACRYRFAGCEEKFTRESTQDHNKEFIQHHLDKAMVKLDNTETRLCKTEARLDVAVELQSTGTSSVVIRIRVPYGSDSISPGFYVTKGGCRFTLKVHVQCWNFSISIAVMSGRHDDVLEWPVKGAVTIQLLNQEEDKDHKLLADKKQVEFKNKVVPPATHGEWIHLGDTPIWMIFWDETHIANNTYFFKVKIDLDTPSKPWLV